MLLVVVFVECFFNDVLVNALAVVCVSNILRLLVVSQVVEVFPGHPPQMITTAPGARSPTGNSDSASASPASSPPIRQFPFVQHLPHGDIVQHLPHGDGLCLALLQRDTKDSSVLRTRTKIGVGLVLSRESNGVWVYNRSRHPVFVNCLAPPTASLSDATAPRQTLVANIHKLPPGYSLQIFDYSWCEALSRASRPEALGQGPSNPYCAQVSFAKGWGARYKRQTVMLCPCWIEILLDTKR